MIKRHFQIALCGVLLLASVLQAQNENDNMRKQRQPADSPEEIRPLLVGQIIPDLEVKNLENQAVALRKAIAEKPTILIFYRGGWCPYCNRHLGQVAEVEEELLKMGYQIIALSPDRPEKLAKTVDKNSLSYQLLSDSKMTVSTAFGLSFKMPDKAVARYKKIGIDLEASSGEDHHLLPVPAAFVLGTDGMIHFSYVNPNYKVRINGDVLLAAAKAALE